MTEFFKGSRIFRAKQVASGGMGHAKACSAKVSGSLSASGRGSVEGP